MITVQHDKTYTPLKAEFDGFLDVHFPGITVPPEQRKIFETFFFAGAVSTYSILVRTPDLQETVLAELSDYEQQTVREKV